MRKITLLAALACVCTATASDSWYWTRAVTCTDYYSKSGYGYTVKSDANFTNVLTGVSGLPVSGDLLLVRGAGGFGQDFGTGLAFGGVTVSGNSTSSSEFVSQGTLTLQAGGAGLVFEDNVTTIGGVQGSVAFTGSGEAIIDVRNANMNFYVQKSLYGNADITLVKRGAGTLKNSQGYAPLNVAKTAYSEARDHTGNYYQFRKFLFGGVKLQEGRLNLSQYYYVFGCDFQFDGNGTTLGVMKFDNNDGKDMGIHSLELKNGRIRETANVTNTTHAIYGEDARCYIHMFGDAMEDSSFSGQMTGAAGLVWQPTSSERSFTFSKSASPTTGRLVVSNGTVRITQGAGFTALSQLLVDGAASVFAIDASAGALAAATPVTLANGGKLKLESGALVGLDALTVEGAAVAPGLYSGVARDDAKLVSWISGAGLLRVGAPPEGAETATWTNAVPANVSAAANWAGGVTPELGGGTTLVTVASTIAGSDDKAGMTLDRDVWLKGLVADLPAWFTVSGEKDFAVGSGGLVAPRAKTLKLAAPTLLMASQTWQVRDSGRIWIANALKGFANADLKIEGVNGACLDFDAAMPAFHGGLFVTNMNSIEVKQTGALGPATAPAAYFYSMPKFTGGITLDRDLWFCKGGTIEGTANTTLTFNGFVCSSNTQTMSVSAPVGSVITFNKLFMSRNGGTLDGVGRIVFKDSFHVRDRPNISETVTVELHKGKNYLGGNMGSFSGGTLRCMKPYVLTKDSTKRQTVETPGNSKDYSDYNKINAKGTFVLDLNGCDQSLRDLAMHATDSASGGHVTSATPATLYLYESTSYWANHNYTQGFSVPSDYSKADSYGYETVDKGYWEGAASLSYNGDTGRVRSFLRASSTTGTLEVVSGKVAFRRAATGGDTTFDLKEGSANPFPRLANEYGAWPSATVVRVKGGVLRLEHGRAFGRKTDVYLSGGEFKLDPGVIQKVHALYIDGVKQSEGLWGSSESAAPAAQQHAYFGGTGLLNVVGEGPCLVLILR